jgi:hypothetical protein
MLLVMLINFEVSFILFIAWVNMFKLTESKADEMSRESIQSSSLLRWVMLYSELSIWMGSNVLWFGRPAKLFFDKILCLERILLRRLVRILVKIFRKVSSNAIGRVSFML